LRRDETGIVSFELRRHRGKPLRLDDGTLLKPGDMLLELHMNNLWFIHNRDISGSAGESRWKVSSAFAEDLRYLARQMMEGAFPTEVKALHGITTLHSPARRLGFTVTELPNNLRRRITTFYLSGLRRVYYFGKPGIQARQRKPPVLNEVWMSRARLLERYQS